MEEEVRAFLSKVKLRSQGGNVNIYELFTRVLNLYSEGSVKDQRAACVCVEEIFADHLDLLKDFQRLFLEQKSDEKSVADLSNLEACTPSYLLLPKHASTSEVKSDLLSEVLNHQCVMVAAKYTSKHMEKNDFEKTLDNLEDQRYEMEMLLERVKGAAEKAEVLLFKLEETSTPDLDIQKSVDEYLFPFNQRCIKQLYGEWGSNMLDMLRKSPSTVLPVIICRLKRTAKNCEDILIRKMRVSI